MYLQLEIGSTRNASSCVEVKTFSRQRNKILLSNYFNATYWLAVKSTRTWCLSTTISNIKHKPKFVGLGGVFSLTPHGLCDGSIDLDLRLSFISKALWGLMSRRVKRGGTAAAAAADVMAGECGALGDAMAVFDGGDVTGDGATDASFLSSNMYSLLLPEIYEDYRRIEIKQIESRAKKSREHIASD